MIVRICATIVLMLVALTFAVALQASNSLTPQEVKDGWKLLFDGKSTTGWHNFKAKGVQPGWVVKDGTLICADPHNAGDILTDEQFDWFELSLEFKAEKDQNSGIMFRVLDSGDATWHSGPEVQIYDHKIEKGVETSGFLYQLYGFEKELAKPAGEWNHLVIYVSPKICSTKLNGSLCYTYVLGSSDFWSRVQKSKFNKFPGYAKAPMGSIAIQGDHGVVSFRNIKIKNLKAISSIDKVLDDR